MKFRNLPGLALVLLLLGSLAACEALTGGEPENPALQMSVDPAESVIAGRVVSLVNGKRQPLPDTVVRLANIYWNEDKSEGAFVVEGATSPSDITDENGFFAFTGLKPGEYVIVVGDLIGKNVIISEPSGKAKIWTTEGGKVLDVGTLEVDLSQ